MTAETLFGLLNPIISMAFAVTFLIFWLAQRERVFPLAISLAFFASALSRSFVSFFYVRGELASMILTDAVYIFGITCLFCGLSWRSHLKAPIVPFVIVGGGLGAICLFIASDLPHANLHLVLSNGRMGVLFLIGFWWLRSTWHNHMVDRLVLSVVLLISVQFLITPHVTLGHEGPISFNELANSTHAAIVSFSTASSLLILALSLLGMCVYDLTQSVREASSIDFLSGLRNRSAFHTAATMALQRLQRNGRQAAMLLIDVDNFKQINDTYGHHAGDEVISKLGKLLCDFTRKSDIRGRVGGEEFCLVLPGAKPHSALIVAESIRRNFNALRFETLDKDTELSLSIGSTEILDTDTVDQAMRRADKALYKAKAAGKNRVCRWEGIIATRQKQARNRILPQPA